MRIDSNEWIILLETLRVYSSFQDGHLPHVNQSLFSKSEVRALITKCIKEYNQTNNLNTVSINDINKQIADEIQGETQ
jgi:hypothetical protein